MSVDELPNPLTPVDCDLAGYRWMPLDVERVIDSDTFGLSTGDEFKTAFRLWAKSWKQVPAASLPNDDRLLAHLAGLEIGTWLERKPIALRGWIPCSDGRLYHPVIAEKAIEAMGRREEHAEREENQQTRQQMHRDRRKTMFAQLRGCGIVPAWDTKTAELERLVATHLRRTGDAPVTPNRHGGDAHETGTGQTCDAPVTPGSPYLERDSGSPVTDLLRTGDAYDAPATAIEKDRTGQYKDITKTKEETPTVVPLPQGEHAPHIASSVSRSIEIAVYLRQRGIVGANSANPNISAWGDDARVTNEILDAALSVVASRNLGKAVGPNYLATIIPDLLAPKPQRRDDNAWKRSDKGIESKASELGIYARAGETHDALRDRCESELRKRAQGVAA